VDLLRILCYNGVLYAALTIIVVQPTSLLAKGRKGVERGGETKYIGYKIIVNKPAHRSQNLWVTIKILLPSAGDRF